MIGFYAEIRKEQGLAAGMVAAAVWFNGDKDGIDVGEGFGIVVLKNPALLCGIIDVEDA